MRLFLWFSNTVVWGLLFTAMQNILLEVNCNFENQQNQFLDICYMMSGRIAFCVSEKRAAKNAHSCIWSVKWNKWQACVMQGERQTCIISSICNTTCVIFTTKLMTRLNCFSWFYPWKLRYEFIFIFLINGVNDCVFHIGWTRQTPSVSHSPRRNATWRYATAMALLGHE